MIDSVNVFHDPKCSTTLQVEQSVLDSHKSSSVSDKCFYIPLFALEGLPESPSISKPFSLVALKYDDFVSILNTRRNASAPGYNVIPYKDYKKCTKINSFLFNVFKSCVKNCVIPIQWRYAKEIYIRSLILWWKEITKQQAVMIRLDWRRNILELIEVWLSKECHSILPFFQGYCAVRYWHRLRTTTRTNEQKIHGYKTLQSTIKRNKYNILEK